MATTSGAFWTQVFQKADGTPYSGVRLFHYVAGGGTVELPAYTNAALTTIAAQPIPGDSAGRVWFFGNGTYRLVVKSSIADGDVTLYDWDGVEVWHPDATLRSENRALSYPAATDANRGLIAAKVDGTGDLTEVAINKTGTAFDAFQFQGDSFTTTQQLAKGADLAAASTLTLGNDGNYFVVASGSGPITAISTKTAGTRILIRWGVALQLTHNATSLILQDGINKQTAVGDMQELVSEGAGNWREEHYWPAVTVLPPPRGYLFGLTISNGVDTVNDLDITAGECTSQDSALTSRVTLAPAAMTKQLDATWAVGTNAGMRVGGLVDGTWHLYAFRRSGASDDFFAQQSLTPTVPDSGTKYRRIGTFLRESGTIVQMVHDGNYFARKATSLVVNVTNPGDTAVLRTVGVPTGKKFLAILNVYFESNDNGAVQSVVLSDPDANDEAPSRTAAPLATQTANVDAVYQNQGHLLVRTNTSGQIRTRVVNSGGSTILRIAALGWIDTRDRTN